MKELDSNFWGEYLKIYDVLNLSYPYKELMDIIISSFSEINNQIIFDAGSGTGNLSIRLSNFGGIVYSLDNSKEGLEIHRLKDKKANTYLHDLSKPLPFKDDFFDSIVSLNTICFIDEKYRDKIFSEFYRVLKDNGELIVVNLLDGFKAYKIFLFHIKFSIKNDGFLNFLKNIFPLFISALKILYYSKIIQKNNGRNRFFNKEEQFSYLNNNRFKKISKSKLIYADQAVFNKANK